MKEQTNRHNVYADIPDAAWRKGTTPGTQWTIIQHARNIHRIVIRQNESCKTNQLILLASDRHHDNAHTDHGLELKHLREAKQKNAICLDFGDAFCAMQGKWDMRSDRSALRPENQQGDYLDSLVRCAAKFYSPFASNMVLWCRGNHETNVLKRHETDLTERLCAMLSPHANHSVFSGGYTGWIIFTRVFGTRTHTLKMHYTHGHGGGGLMSHGTLHTRRIASYVGSDCDVFVSGHTHDSWIVTLASQRLVSARGEYKTVIKPVNHIKCGTYKDEFGDGHGGWHIETGKPPKAIGAVWMSIGWNGTSDEGELGCSFRRAD